MCGIAGIVSSIPVPGNYIQQMANTIIHRGPDDEGLKGFSEGRLWIGNRRLSIIDISSAGHQPMEYRDGRYWISYNGEIYNYIELKEQLEQFGHIFVSGTDTEVILAAYDHWGKDCLDRLNGMWAFILYDRAKNTIFVSRDRFGIKPLYYWFSPVGFIAFASEIKEFTALPGWNPVMNGQRVYDFLNWGLTDHTRETLFNNVYQIRGGEALQLNVGSVETFLRQKNLPIYRWYELSPIEFQGKFEEAAETFRLLLTDAVRLRLRADVPVGSCLSGGIDSSSIVCLANALLKQYKGIERQKTFSLCSRIQKYDEREFINEIVRVLDIDPYYTYTDLENLFATLDNLTWHQDEPFCSTSIYAQRNVFRLASENGVKVMLDGQGADEQLAGYPIFFGPRLLSLFKRLQWSALTNEIRAMRELHGYDLLSAIEHLANMILPEGLRQKARRLLNKSNTTPEWINLKALGAEPEDPYAKIGGKAHSVQELSIAQLTATNLSMLLHWEDRNSMAHSIESRLPFLDYRIVEFVLGLPDEYKLSAGITKQVLREAMRGILPEKIRTRMNKMAFATPEEVWMRKEGADRFKKVIKKTVVSSQGILNERALEKCSRIIDGKESFSHVVWRFISFGAWVNTFSVKLHE